MMELLLSQAYQALGSFQLALLHHIRYTELSDSIFNVEKIKQFQTLLMRYETRQREQALQLVQLQNQKELVQVQEISLQRNMTLGGILLLLIFALLALRGYRLTRKHVLQLQMQQTIIYRQNAVQQDLIGEKDKLLTDKDLLLNEIHYRVQNNLYLISSLLESQGAYLQNEALHEIQKSQHRVQAISLIHQKLFLDGQATDIDMSVYLREIIGYLRDSLVADDSLVFHLDLDPIHLDVTKAVPLGLIVNEAVTNAVKYAFPRYAAMFNVQTTRQQGGILDQEAPPLPGAGRIVITLKQAPTGEYHLRVADNGVGLPGTSDGGQRKSLGMSLIEGLSRALQAGLHIHSGPGTTIEVVFAKAH
jgi:two-component system, sensor histidine kinase PdtaS